MQRVAGNHSVDTLLQRSPATSSGPSLRIGAPDAPEEREADRIAAEVMRMPDDAVPRSIGTSSPALHRKCAACNDEEEKLHRSASGESPGTAPPMVHQVLSRPGQPLPDSTRSFFEPRFGADLSRVRIHTDTQAARSADAVQAKAYTVGKSIAFADGQYSPHSESGKGLLAHELVHVVQGDRDLRRAPVHSGSSQTPYEPPTPPTLPPTADAPAPPANSIGPGKYDDQLVATWGWLWKTKLTARKRAPRTFDALPTAMAFGTSLGGPAAIFKEDQSYVAYSIKYTALHSFTFTNAKINYSGNDCDIQPVQPFAVLLTEDGVAIYPHQLKGADGKATDDYNSPPEAQDHADPNSDPFSARKEVFGEGLERVTDREPFLHQFEMTMRDTVFTLLDRSEADAKQKQIDLAGGIPEADSRVIQRVLDQLLPLDKELIAARDRYSLITLVRHAKTDADIREAAKQDSAEVSKRISELEVKRRVLLLDYPLLSQVNAEEFSRLNPQERGAKLKGSSTQVLADIAETRRNILEGRLNLWTLDPLIQTTLTGLGIADKERVQWVTENSRHEGHLDLAISIALGVIQIGLSIGAVAVGGPVGAAFAVGALGVGIADATRMTNQYFVDKAAANTDVNKNQALVPADLDGQWPWLVVAWVGVGISYLDVVKAVRVVKAGELTLEGMAKQLARGKEATEEKLLEIGKSFRSGAKKLDVAGLKAVLLDAVSETAKNQFKNLEVQVVDRKVFASVYGSETGDAVSVISKGTDGSISVKVVFREGGNPLAIRHEAAHLEQAADPKWTSKLAEVSEETLANWSKLSGEQQMRLYSTKIEVEIDAQERLIKKLGEVELDEFDEAENVLAALQERQTQVKSALENPDALKQGKMPSWWDSKQEPRLFAKSGRLPRNDGHWVGKPGEGVWHPDDPETKAIVGDKGITFKNGFPDFSPYAADKITLPKFRGRTADVAAADKELAKKLRRTVNEIEELRKGRYTWHHHQDCVTMQLLPMAIHRKVPHVGGVSGCL